MKFQNTRNRSLAYTIAVVGVFCVTLGATFLAQRWLAPQGDSWAAQGWQGEKIMYQGNSVYCSGMWSTQWANWHYGAVNRADPSNTITLTDIVASISYQNERWANTTANQNIQINMRSPANNATWNIVNQGWIANVAGIDMCGWRWNSGWYSAGNRSLSVSGSQNTITMRVGHRSSGSDWSTSDYADWTVDIPAATAPAIGARSVTANSASVLALSAGSISRGNYSSINTISLNYGTTTSYGSTKTLYSGSTTAPGVYASSITGLTGNTRYYYRWNAVNSAPLTTTYTGSTVTLPTAPVLGVRTALDTTSAGYNFTASNGGGAYTVTKYVRYRESGSSEWTDSPATSTATSGSLSIIGLLGNTTYDIQPCSVTTAGTTCGTIQVAAFTTLDYSVAFSLSPDTVSITPTTSSLANETVSIGHTVLDIQTANPLGVDVVLETTTAGTDLICSTDPLATIPSVTASGATISPVNRWGWGLADTNSATPAFTTWNPVPNTATNIHSGPIANGLKLGFGVKVNLSQQTCSSYSRELTVTVLGIVPEVEDPIVASFTMSPDLDGTYGGNTVLSVVGMDLENLDTNVYYEEWNGQGEYYETLTGVLTCTSSACTSSTITVSNHGAGGWAYGSLVLKSSSGTEVKRLEVSLKGA